MLTFFVMANNVLPSLGLSRNHANLLVLIFFCNVSIAEVAPPHTLAFVQTFKLREWAFKLRGGVGGGVGGGLEWEWGRKCSFRMGEDSAPFFE